MNAEKDRVRLQTYVTKVESHNNELEQSLRILKRRLAMLEEKENTLEDRLHSENVNSQNGDTVGDKNGIQNSGRKDKANSSIHTLVGKIHDRVSDYILRKIDSELSNLGSDTHIDENHSTSHDGAESMLYTVPPHLQGNRTQSNVGNSVAFNHCNDAMVNGTGYVPQHTNIRNSPQGHTVPNTTQGVVGMTGHVPQYTLHNQTYRNQVSVAQGPKTSYVYHNVVGQPLYHYAARSESVNNVGQQQSQHFLGVRQTVNRYR